MASKLKDVNSGKEKSGISPTTPRNVEVPYGKPAKSSSITGSPNRNSPSDKSHPNYLKSTISSCHDCCKSVKKQPSASSDEKKRLPGKKLLEKSASLPQKNPSTASPKQMKPLTPSLKTPFFAKPISEKSSNMPRSGNTVQSPKVNKGPGLRRTSSEKKERLKSVAVSDTTQTQKAGSFRCEEEEKGTAIEVEQDLEKAVNVEEQSTVEIQGLLDQSANGSNNPEANISDQEKLETCSCDNLPISSNSTLGEHEIAETVEVKTEIVQEEVEEQNQSVNEEREHEEEEEEQEQDFSDYSEKSGSCEDGNGEHQGETKTDSGNTGEGEENRGGCKLQIRQKRESGNEENGKMGCRGRRFQVKQEPATGNSGNGEEPENVVLKKSDVQGKKESQMFNDVIEETSKKLVESRKSKVKALVGAFETVISLQETEGQGQIPTQTQEGLRNEGEGTTNAVDENDDKNEVDGA